MHGAGASRLPIDREASVTLKDAARDTALFKDVGESPIRHGLRQANTVLERLPMKAGSGNSFGSPTGR